jgi:hypothetical protein
MAIIRLQVQVERDDKGALKATIGELEEVDQKAKKAQASVSGFGKALEDAASHVATGLGLGAGFSIATKAAEELVSAIKAIPEAFFGTMKSAHDVEVLGLKMALTTTQAQELSYATKITGGNVESLARGVVQMQQGIVDDTPKVALAIRTLGLSAEGLRHAGTYETLMQVNQALKGLDDTAQPAVLKDLFGRGAIENIATFKADLAGLAAQAHATGAVMGEEMVHNLAENEKAWLAVKEAAAGFVRQIFASGPGLADWLKHWAEGVGALVAELRKLPTNWQGTAGWQGGAMAMGAGAFVGAGDRAPGSGRDINLPGPGKMLPGGMDQAEWDAMNDAANAVAERYRQEDIHAAAKAAESLKQLNEEIFHFKNETYKRDHEATLKYWKDQEKQAEQSTKKLIAAWALAHGYADNAHIRQIAGVQIDDARRNASLAMGGSGGLVSETTTDVSRFWSRDPKIAAALKANEGHLFGLRKATLDWARAFEDVGQAALDVARSIGGPLGDAIAGIGGALQGLAAHDRQAAENMKLYGKEAMTTNQKVAAGAQAAMGAISIYRQGGGFVAGSEQGAAAGSSFGPWGVVIGAVVGGILGALGKGAWDKKARDAGDILGRRVSVEYVKGLEKAAEAAGMSLNAFIKQLKAAEDLAKAIQKDQDVRSGLATAQAGLDAIYKALPELADTPELHAAIAVISQKVADAMAKAGLGYLVTGALKESKQYGAAQAVGVGAGQVLSGMRQAGYVDAGLTAAMGGLAGDIQKQAYDAAIAAGLGPEEATKAGFGAITPILTEQLNNSLATGQKLDEKTQALIDQAKANGINIVADPLLYANKLAQDQLDELIAINKSLGKPAPGNPAPPTGTWHWTGAPPPIGHPPAPGWDFYGAGGYVPPTPGGRHIVVGERGEGEYIIPRSRIRSSDSASGMTIHLHTTVAPTIDPSMSAQTQREAIDQLVEGVEREIRLRNPRLEMALRRAVGAPTR